MKLNPPTTSSPNPAAPAISRIGRFYITRELGRSAIGTVYLARDPIIDRDVALKTFNQKLTLVQKKQYGQQLVNEARAAGRLSHPNLITIFEALHEGDTTYIAMEYLQGKELHKILENGKPFPPDEVVSIIWKLADALDFAHKNGVIHRDIKPANIFIIGQNNPKLMDFGIARAPNRISDTTNKNDEPYTLFRNNILGTPYYMSPEQATGQPVDLRTDIYSLGAVMYEMLAGRKPFLSADAEKLMELIAYKAPSKPHEVNPEVPLALSLIAMKAISKKPEKRYQNAEEMALDIKRYMVQGKRQKRLALQVPMKAEEQDAAMASATSQRRLLWLGCLAIVVALFIIGLAVLR